MLNRLPKYAGTFKELTEDLGLKPTDAGKIAKALDVSERTVWRWMKSGAPKTACISLWWLSREGHSVWDCEMQNRTALALSTNKTLWREIKNLRNSVLMARTQALTDQWRGPAKNDASYQPSKATDAMRPHWGSPSPRALGSRVALNDNHHDQNAHYKGQELHRPFTPRK